MAVEAAPLLILDSSFLIIFHTKDDVNISAYG
jgi:hypothetical protein